MPKPKKLLSEGQLPSGMRETILADMAETLTELANQHIESGAIKGKDYPRSIIDAHDVAFGIWQDAAEPHGVGFMVIKGDVLMHKVVDEDKTLPASLTAIPCRSPEEAHAMRLVFGDLAKRH